MLQVVLLGAQRVSVDERVHAGKVGHGAGVQLSVCVDGRAVVVGIVRTESLAGELFAHLESLALWVCVGIEKKSEQRYWSESESTQIADVRDDRIDGRAACTRWCRRRASRRR